jgi:hypothetical protein
LARSPIKEGESRVVKAFIPELNKICLYKLAAKKKEPVTLGKEGTKKELMRIEQVVTDLEDKPVTGMDQTFWVDDGGQVLKSVSDLLGGMVAYRTTKSAALAVDGDFDLLTSSILKVKRKIPNSTGTRDIVYRLSVTGEDPRKLIPSDHRQTLQPDASSSALMEIRADDPNSGEPGPESVADEYLRPNPLVNSDDPEVIRLMKKALARAGKDAWSQAVAIEEWVFNNMKQKNFGVGFAPAAEVARNLSGDCSEHGVLAAAMCRAAGIPARCVVGLVYADHLGGFGPHLWNEVYVNRRWVAIDATFNESQVDATHIKLAETSLDGLAPFEAFLPVVRVWNKLKIEPTEIR